MTVPTFFDAPGSPRDRGRAIGEALREGIGEHLSAWHGALARGGVEGVASYVLEFVAASSFLEAADRETPHLVEEIRGIAEGARVNFAAAFALQLIDEEWVHRASRPLAQVSRDKCSSLAVADRASGRVWIAQNMDLGAYTDGLQLLVRYAADAHGPAQLVFTLAGHLGLMGVNEAGVGLCCNSLPQLPSATRGLPVAFAVRRVLEGRTARECADIVRTLPHATNQHYLLADAGTIISLEASAAGVTEYRPVSPDRVLHTNHPLSGATEVHATSAAHRANTEGRLASLGRSLSASTIGLEPIQTALSSLEGEYPVCRQRSNEPGLINFTTGSMITPLDAAEPVETFVAFGPPSERPYHRFDFTSVPAKGDR